VILITDNSQIAAVVESKWVIHTTSYKKST